MEKSICIVGGLVGGTISTVFGGWGAAMTTLIIFMALDYITGLVVAGVFNKSTKIESGNLESKAGWKGLCRKGMTLTVVLIASRLDLMMNTTFVRDAVIIGYVVNETISIIENAGLMGLPIPTVLTKAIAVLKEKSESEGN
ncbi:MAG: phage holin family protein [Lachnospiraceae bacterium]